MIQKYQRLKEYFSEIKRRNKNKLKVNITSEPFNVNMIYFYTFLNDNPNPNSEDQDEMLYNMNFSELSLFDGTITIIRGRKD